MNYVLGFRDADGAPVTGLAATFTCFRTVSGNSTITYPTITSLYGGIYTFAYSATTGIDVAYVIDGTATITDSNHRYKMGIVSPNDDNVAVSNLQVGANSVTITVVDSSDGTTPVPDVSMLIENSGQTAVINSGKTDASGQVVVALDDGTYKVTLAKSMWNFTVPETLTVSGTTTDSYEGTEVSPSTPSANNQTLYDHVLHADGTGASGAVVTAYIVSVPTESSSNFVSNAKVSSTCDTNGYFELELIQGITVNIVIKDGTSVLFNDTITVSADATKELSAYSY